MFEELFPGPIALARHRTSPLADERRQFLRHLHDLGYTRLTVDPSTDEHLQDQQPIRDEAESWLASLDATVHGVNIRKAD